MRKQLGKKTLHMPDYHKLPFYYGKDPLYDRALPRIAKMLARIDGGLHLIDVGANIGDTVSLVTDKIGGSFLCIEGDVEYVPFLKKNAEIIIHENSSNGAANIVIEECYLGANDGQSNMSVQRAHGTAQLVKNSSHTIPVKTLDTVVSAHQEFKKTNLLKIDTDGFEIDVLKGAQSLLAESQPAVYFEFDPGFYSNNHSDPFEVFDILLKHGYKKALMYDNFGLPRKIVDISDKEELQRMVALIDKSTVYYFDILAVPQSKEQKYLSIINEEFLVKKLSVITITYNNPGLSRTLDSMLSQKISPDDIEHVIVDNLSNNGTDKIVQEYIAKAPYRVIYIREADKGRYDAMNKGIKAAHGEYLSFMNAGDHFFNEQGAANILIGAQGCDIAYGDLNVVDETNPRDRWESVYYPPDTVDFGYFLHDSALPHQASVIRRGLFEETEFYDSSYPVIFDGKFFLVAILKYKASYVHVNKTIATFYVGGASSNASRIVELEKSKVYTTEFSHVIEKTSLAKNKDVPVGFGTPILFLTFNRPETTQKVFAKIRMIRPTKLYVASDAARIGKKGEREAVEKVRNYILEHVDWACEVKMLVRDENLGCGRAVSGAINWFFGQESEGVILEDDCVPDDSFFGFAAAMLEKYRDDVRVTHVSGTATVPDENKKDTYYFSKYFNIWGWATWRRAWNNYCFALIDYRNFLETSQIANVFSEKSIQEFWLHNFNMIHERKTDTWDFQWSYANFINNGLAVTPYVNLISNIGFGDDATHTHDAHDLSASRQTGRIGNIVHPTFVIHDVMEDNKMYSVHHHLTMGSSDGFSPIFRESRFATIKKKIKERGKDYIDGLFRGRLRQVARRVYHALKKYYK